MTPRPSAIVWLPLLLVALGVVVAVDVSVVVAMWGFAGLALTGAVVRAFNWGSGALRVRRRAVDASVLAFFAVAIAFVASSGVLD